MRSIYNRPGIYVIRVAGALPPDWSDRLGGLTIVELGTARECDVPVSELSGSLADQSALCGVLFTLYDDRFPLLYVEDLGPTEG